MEKIDNTLDVDIAQLEIGELARTESSSIEQEKKVATETIRRSSRKIIRPFEIEKKRVISKPKRLSDNNKSVINYYLDKKIKRLPSTLETIFEHPKSDNFMSKRKFSRILPARDLDKTKKVQTRSKKMKTGKFKKLSMDLLLKKLAQIDDSNFEIKS